MTEGPEMFRFLNGVARVHPRSDCAGSHCCIHNPSLHSMVEEPMVLRETGLVERQCRHGVGHPDPDSLAYLESRGFGGFGIHGCDGCCAKLVQP